MCNQEQETNALLQQIALSLGNITYAIDAMISTNDPISLEQVRSGLEMIRNHTEASCERIYAHQGRKPNFYAEVGLSLLTDTLSSLSEQTA